MNVLISTKPIIICLEAVLVCAMVRTAVSLSAAIPLGTSTKRADFASVRIFLKMPFQPCPLGCGYFLSSVDSHDRSLQCLGIQHAEAAFVDGLCVRSERVTMAALPSRLFLLRGNGGAPSVTARAGFSVIPSSLPSVVGRLGGRLTFPKWRVKLQCTCACKTPALGGIVIVSLPKYVSWRPLSRPKLTVLRPSRLCMLWLSCEHTKPKALKCTRVVPTWGWRRNCARRLTLPYGRRKSQRGPSGRRCPCLWSKSAIYDSALLRGAMSTKCAFLMLSSPRLDCSATLSRTVPRSSRQYRSRPRPSNTSYRGVMHHLPPLCGRASPSLLVAVGALLCPPELHPPPPLNRE